MADIHKDVNTNVLVEEFGCDGDVSPLIERRKGTRGPTTLFFVSGFNDLAVRSMGWYLTNGPTRSSIEHVARMIITR